MACISRLLRVLRRCCVAEGTDICFQQVASDACEICSKASDNDHPCAYCIMRSHFKQSQPRSLILYLDIVRPRAWPRRQIHDLSVYECWQWSRNCELRSFHWQGRIWLIVEPRLLLSPWSKRELVSKAGLGHCSDAWSARTFDCSLHVLVPRSERHRGKLRPCHLISCRTHYWLGMG